MQEARVSHAEGELVPHRGAVVAQVHDEVVAAHPQDPDAPGRDQPGGIEVLSAHREEALPDRAGATAFGGRAEGRLGQLAPGP